VDYLLLLLGLLLILGSAHLFTNGVEWLGFRFGLSHGVVGSVLAAVGTALPESVIPLVALLLGGGDTGHAIGTGAILGAPFMLSTLALFILGVAVVLYSFRRPSRPRALLANPQVIGGDLRFFLISYVLALLAGLPWVRPVKLGFAILLCLLYLLYLHRTFSRESPPLDRDEVEPLMIARHLPSPPLLLILFQVLLALGVMVGGARVFVRQVETLAELWGVSPLLLSLVIAPVATELPEKFNSIIWVGRSKDTLALGNITGAMVFQGSLLPALGLALTPWRLGYLELITATISLFSAFVLYLGLVRREKLGLGQLFLAGAFYFLFLLLVF